MSAHAGTKGSPVRRAVRGAVLLVLTVTVGGMIALAPDIAMPMTVLMLPGLITLLIDGSPTLGLARAMLLFQAAACVGPVADAWYRCSGIHGCLDYLGEPATVVRAWAAAAAAWVLAQVVPIILKVVEDLRLREKRARLEDRRKELISEWGLEKDAKG